MSTQKCDAQKVSKLSTCTKFMNFLVKKVHNVYELGGGHGPFFADSKMANKVNPVIKVNCGMSFTVECGTKGWPEHGSYALFAADEVEMRSKYVCK